MTDKKETEKVVEQPKGKTIKEATIQELKAEAFDIGSQINFLQKKYDIIVQEIQLRQNK